VCMYVCMYIPHLFNIIIIIKIDKYLVHCSEMTRF